MFDIRKIRAGEFLYRDGSRVAYEASPNKWQGWRSKPKFLVIHYTAAGPASGSISWFKNPASKVSAHLTIARDGAVTQSVPFDDRSWHAGTSSWTGQDGTRYKDLNQHSIGIELANAGACQRTAAGTWRNDLGIKVAPEDIIEAEHKNGPVWFNSRRHGIDRGNTREPGWETYPPEQKFAALQVAIALVDHYGLEDVLGHDDISPGRKTDPGPLFDMSKFRSHVFGRSEEGESVWKVRPNTPDGLAIRMGPSKNEAKVMDRNLAPGTKVEFNESDGKWWFVTVLDDNDNDVTDGWVYSKYLVRA